MNSSFIQWISNVSALELWKKNLKDIRSRVRYFRFETQNEIQLIKKIK
jgi:hypothetical protein